MGYYTKSMFEDQENSKRTKISELGEFGLIDHLTKKIELKNTSSIIGIGDDAAVIDAKGLKTVVTTDFLFEGVHFDLTYTPLKHLGYKAIMANLSDIYAMNAIPSQVTVSIGISNRFMVEDLDILYEGILLACEYYNIDVVGGDTSTSHSGLVISVTAIGHVKEEDIVKRTGAKENDLICVSGDLGAAYMGLQLLEREKEIFHENPEVQPDFSKFEYLLERQLKPEARKDIIELLNSRNIKPTSMIDISDGLSSEIIHICKKSKVGCSIFEDKIPLDTETVTMAEEFNISPTVCALNGGEDYELLFTIALDDYEKIKEIKEISVIGHITADESKYDLISGENAIPLKAQGWNALMK